MHFAAFKNQFNLNSQGIYSVCSAHPVVIRAALQLAGENRMPLLVESTVNQVNHQGGYTGMRPADFKAFVSRLAKKENFPLQQLILGGDHLGPYPWRALPAAEAMEHAFRLVAEAVQAGYRKLHLDPSMPCKDDPEPLPVEVIAERTAQMAAVAEQSARQANADTNLFYVVGTEVPPPGGATTDHDVQVTSVQQVKETIAAIESAFRNHQLTEAWERVIAIVVQPGVEFSNTGVVNYHPLHARHLRALQEELRGIVFEAHSTDYQLPDALRQLVLDGFAILKVGPWLTFSFREGVWGLAHIETALWEAGKIETPSRIQEVLLQAMAQEPVYWKPYARHRVEQLFGLSDRIRYYWHNEGVERAINQLITNLKRTDIPIGLLSQYFSDLYPFFRAGELEPDPEIILLEKVRKVLTFYHRAVQ